MLLLLLHLALLDKRCGWSRRMTGIGCEVVAAEMGHTDSVTVEEKQKPRHLGENPFRLGGAGEGQPCSSSLRAASGTFLPKELTQDSYPRL